MTWLYLPITSQPRELDSKLVLAHAARAAGLRPVIGYKSSFMTRLARLQPGIFLAHNARQKLGRLGEVSHFGHAVVVLDEEALVRQSDEIFWKKHPENAFAHVDKILSWGTDDAALWPRYGVAKPEEVAVVGNPRFDLLRPELAHFHSAEVAALHERFGRYVLFNTNFPTVNNLTPQGGGVRMAEWAMDAKGQALNDRFLSFKNEMLAATCALIAPLARAIAPLSLVVRPHPNEDHAPWLRAADGQENVHVIFEGNVVPWLIGAEALVHNNCTTGVEGVAAAKTVLNFVPFRSEFDNPLFHAFGTDCADAAEIAAALSRGAAETEARQAADRDRLRPHVASVDGPLSATRIAALIAQGGPGLAPARGPGVLARGLSTAQVEARRQLRLLSWKATKRGKAKRRLLAERHPHTTPDMLDAEQLRYSPQQLDLMMRQYPPLDLAAVDARLARLAEALGHAAPFRAKPLPGRLVEIA